MAVHRKRRYATGRKSKAIDDRTGFKVNYKDLRREWNGLMVHKDEWEAKHPQLEPRSVVDAQQLRDPRPDGDVDLTQVKIRFGVSATGIVGNELDQGAGNIPVGIKLTGVSSTTALGTEIPTAQATPSGVSSTTAIGTITAGVGVTGVSSTTAIGTVSLQIDADVAVTGESTTVALGNEVPTSMDLPAGVSATGAIGTVHINAWGADAWGHDFGWGN